MYLLYEDRLYKWVKAAYMLIKTHEYRGFNHSLFAA